MPGKFEAGTANIAEAIGLGAAAGWLQTLGLDAIREHEQALVGDALERLTATDGITVHGPVQASERGALVSFVVQGAHPHDVGEILGREGVCVRAGHHCAQPLMRRLGVSATTRASFAVHNSTDDLDRLMRGLESVRRTLRL
jgi:cysteine desulfurase/selenocysteine lyase